MRKLSKPVKNILVGAAVIAGIHLVSALTLDRAPEYKTITYTTEKLPRELEGYTAVFLTDIHRTSGERLKKMVDKINEIGPDIVLMGGDFQVSRQDECLGILSEIKAPDGFFGVEGNHDDADILRKSMERHGMFLLENDGVQVGEWLYIGGVEDLWNRTPDVEKALEYTTPGRFNILLAHNPDVTMEHDVSAAQLTLSGHTHGGEVNLFGLWGPAMPLVSKYGQRFRNGWCKSAADTDVYVSNGVGVSFIMRVFARPQVIVLKLTGG